MDRFFQATLREANRMTKWAGLVVWLLLLSSAAFGQDGGRFDVAVGAAAMFGKQTVGNGTVQTSTTNTGFLASGRMRLGGKSSIEADWGRTHDTQEYLANSLSYRIPTTISEFTGAYVFRPFETKRFRPFLLAGAGVLIFNPNDTLIDYTFQSIGAVRQVQPAFLYGGGLDYHLLSALSLRVQYRGLFFNAPSFHVSPLLTGQRGHIAEPAVSLVIRF
jgi:outer membrane immunogenic protein